MSTILCPSIPEAFASAENHNRLFDAAEIEAVEALALREQPVLGKPGESCKTKLFFGFFFDGTKNNYVLAENAKNHSNVARLYDCYPGLSVPNVLPTSADWQYNPSRYTHFFKVYVPGVASPFKEVHDSGDGSELTRGAAAGYRGDARILWGLIQAVNNVHRYFHKRPLVEPGEMTLLLTKMNLEKMSRRAMTSPPQRVSHSTVDYGVTQREFKKILTRLHAAVSPHWPDPVSKRPKKTDPGIVTTIHFSIFGFSRGATQARAFTNWLMALSQLDAQMRGQNGMTLGGFQVKFDFLGLFDTVASIGAGNTLGNSMLGRLFDGHGAWADAEESLRIPGEIPCVHLVAAHEIRRSFPVDSVAVGQTLPAGCQEVVIPGVHSDLGCGYSPCEQGKGTDPDGEDMLCRIPLVYMYKQARLAGVPLKLELASEIAKRRFKVAPATIKAFNAYLDSCSVKSGSITAIMREQSKLHMQWRLARRIGSKHPLETTRSFLRASAFDQNDLHSANREFEAEIAAFEVWLAEKGKNATFKTQSAGFDNEHLNEWEEIATWWKKSPTTVHAVLNFFDEYVHDSRAWFKLIPGNPDNEADMHARLNTWATPTGRVLEKSTFLAYQSLLKKPGSDQPTTPRGLDGLTDQQRKAAGEYKRTKKIPRMLNEGREPFDSSFASYGLSSRGGYLRYRKVYGGKDSVLLSSTPVDKSKQFV